MPSDRQGVLMGHVQPAGNGLRWLRLSWETNASGVLWFPLAMLFEYRTIQSLELHECQLYHLRSGASGTLAVKLLDYFERDYFAGQLGSVAVSGGQSVYKLVEQTVSSAESRPVLATPPLWLSVAASMGSTTDGQLNVLYREIRG